MYQEAIEAHNVANSGQPFLPMSWIYVQFMTFYFDDSVLANISEANVLRVFLANYVPAK